jgi:hypothetical protein
MIKTAEKEALRDLAVIAKQNDVHICIFRSSRKIAYFGLKIRHYNSTRRAGDWDLAAQVADWEAFKRLGKTSPGRILTAV